MTEEAPYHLELIITFADGGKAVYEMAVFKDLLFDWGNVESANITSVAVVAVPNR